jgi:hypothetical protein
METREAGGDGSNDPYCSNCSYNLRGLTDSSKCPECGRPLVEVLTRRAFAFRAGKRYRSPLNLFGLPLVDIAFGASGTELVGRARGIIAIGDQAKGWLAIGSRAMGLIAIGGLAIGVFAFGGGAIGVIAVGGGALGLMCAFGGGAAGFLALGGGAVGYIAQGGSGAGVWFRGQDGTGVHLLTAAVRDPRAVQFFNDWRWLLGPPPPAGIWVFPTWMITASVGFALILAGVLFTGYVLQIRGIMDKSSSSKGP